MIIINENNNYVKSIYSTIKNSKNDCYLRKIENPINETSNEYVYENKKRKKENKLINKIQKMSIDNCNLTIYKKMRKIRKKSIKERINRIKHIKKKFIKNTKKYEYIHEINRKKYLNFYNYG
jgi:hypothetical protein